MKSAKEWSIFVAGFPHFLQVTDVRDYFSGFGKVTHVKRLKTASEKICHKLVAANKSSYLKILNPQEPHKFQDRRLIIKPFVKGKQLAKLNKDMNSCRVIAKNVPSSITQTQFQNWVSQVAGPVANLYYFQKTGKRKSTSRAKRTYSILFEHQESAEQLVRLAAWQFEDGNGPSKFERFIFGMDAKGMGRVEPSPNIYSSKYVDIQIYSTGFGLFHGDQPVQTATATGNQNRFDLSLHSSKPTASRYRSLRNLQTPVPHEISKNLLFRISRPHS